MALSLAQVVAEKTNALRLLEEAYDARFGGEGGQAVVLEAMLETARTRGFFGSLELAVGVLRASGRFDVKPGPVGKWQAVRQSTALVPIAMQTTALAPLPPLPKTTALVPLDDRPRSTALVPIPARRRRAA